MLGVEAPVGNHNNHGQVLHLGVQLEKAKALGAHRLCLNPVGLPCICTSSSTTGCSGVPVSAERGQNAPSSRWFAALSSDAHSRKASA